MDFKIAKINSEISAEAQKYYTIAFQKALSNKSPLKIEVDNYLSSRGLLNAEQEEKDREKLDREIKDLEKVLRSAQLNGQKMTPREGRDIAILIRQKRRELSDIGTSRSNMYDQTAEKQGENERIQYLVYATCIDNKSGRRYWDSFDDFKNETNSDSITSAFKKFYSEIGNINLDTIADTYENKWLKRMKFADPEGNLVDEKGRRVDEDGRLVNKDGRFIDEDGDFVDKYGNKVNEAGELLMRDEWGVLEEMSDEAPKD